MPGDTLLSYVTTDTDWFPVSEVWVYASADAPTYTFTIAGVDKTTKYSAGMRVRLVQATGGTKYGIITKVAFSTDTTVTLYMGTDYSLANESISVPHYSTHKAPYGFPLDPTKWTVETLDTSDRSQATPTFATWYNINSTSIVVPIGIWDLSYQVIAYADDNTGGGSGNAKSAYTTLSTANNSASDHLFTGGIYSNDVNTGLFGTIFRSRKVTLTAKQTYYLNAYTDHSNLDNLILLNSFGTLVIRAECAYL